MTAILERELTGVIPDVSATPVGEGAVPIYYHADDELRAAFAELHDLVSTPGQLGIDALHHFAEVKIPTSVQSGPYKNASAPSVQEAVSATPPEDERAREQASERYILELPIDGIDAGTTVFDGLVEAVRSDREVLKSVTHAPSSDRHQVRQARESGDATPLHDHLWNEMWHASQAEHPTYMSAAYPYDGLRELTHLAESNPATAELGSLSTSVSFFLEAFQKGTRARGYGSLASAEQGIQAELEAVLHTHGPTSYAITEALARGDDLIDPEMRYIIARAAEEARAEIIERAPEAPIAAVSMHDSDEPIWSRYDNYEPTPVKPEKRRTLRRLGKHALQALKRYI